MSRTFNETVDEALRVTGRLVAFAALTGATLFLLGIALRPFFPSGLPAGATGRQVYLTLIVLALVVGTVLVVALLEKGEWRLTGLGKAGWSPRAIGGGLALGLLVPALLFGTERLLGAAAPIAWRVPSTTLLVVVIASTLVDALMLRGYALGLLASRVGDLAAAVAMALPATLVALNDGTPTPLTAIDALVMATCLGVFRLRTGSLAATWIVHLLIDCASESAGRGPLPGMTAGLLVVVTFLLFRLRPRTHRPGRA